jgi:hypothetical protein
MSHRFFRHSVALMGAVLAVGGCATSTSGSSDANGLGFTANQLCALVTTADVSSALGVSVGTGVGSGVNAPACVWQGAGAGATIAAIPVSSVGQVPFGMQGLDNHRATPVSGLGDAAYFAAAGDIPNAELDIKKGGRAIDITVGVSGFTQTQQEAAEQAIGVAAVKHF